MGPELSEILENLSVRASVLRPKNVRPMTGSRFGLRCTVGGHIGVQIGVPKNCTVGGHFGVEITCLIDEHSLTVHEACGANLPSGFILVAVAFGSDPWLVASQGIGRYPHDLQRKRHFNQGIPLVLSLIKILSGLAAM